MAEAKSEKETWLNYTIQPLEKHFLDAYHPCNSLQKEIGMYFSV